jgi:hypothetical protein
MITTSLYTGTQRVLHHRNLQGTPVNSRRTLANPFRKVMPVALRPTPSPLLLAHITQFASSRNAKHQGGRGFGRHVPSFSTASTNGHWKISALWRMNSAGASNHITKATPRAYLDNDRTSPDHHTDGAWKTRKTNAVIATEVSISRESRRSSTAVTNAHSLTSSSSLPQQPHGISAVQLSRHTQMY